MFFKSKIIKFFFNFILYLFFFKILYYYFYINYNDILYIFLFYFFFNLFFYFNTKYQISIFNSFTKNFWIKSFFLFWVLEFFLFFIFLYLLIICPEKQYYAFEILNNHQFKKGNFKNSNITLFAILVLIFSLNISSLFKTNNYIITNFFYLITLYLIFFIFKNELKFFFSSFGVLTDVNFDYIQNTELSFLNNKNKIYFYHTKNLFITKDIIEYRPKVYMLSTIIFLKFFHIIFIVILHILNILKYLKNEKSTYLMNTISLQNLLILLIFYILNWTLPIKYLFYFLIKFNYRSVNLFYSIDYSNIITIVREIYNFVLILFNFNVF